MYELFAGYFPRLHTAIAEWIICAAFICPLRIKEISLKRAAVALLFLGAQLATFYAMELFEAQGVSWTMFMTLGMVEMLAFISLSCAKDWTLALYYWAHAFLVAELAASAEWQINYYLIRSGVIRSIHQTYIIMAIIFAAAFIMVIISRKKAEPRSGQRPLAQVSFSAAGIAVGAFIISNIQFAFQGSAFSASLGDGVQYARTLVDLSGVIMLYANSAQRREMYLKYELDAISNLLARQHEQYQQFEANNEAMRRVYHNLKHQIAYLESEPSNEKRQASLLEMKEIIRVSESKVDTGSTVLDTLLTSKLLICADEGILMTCYADAKALEFIDIMDICSIFGNTIDNAIEYERKAPDPADRLIKVLVGERGQFILIRIDNYCKEQIDFVGDTPATTKADKRLHGFGLKSVRRSVEKYQGHINVEQKDGWFTVTILIPLPKDSEKR